jgi:hypothetical protein
MAIPVLTFRWQTHPLLAENIWHAQAAGHPRILTYNGPDVTLRRWMRAAALHFDDEGIRREIPRILSRDEYPFACTVEGGPGAWVGHIPGRENCAQGGLIAAFLARNGIVANRGEESKFEVRVEGYTPAAATRARALARARVR